MILAYKLYFQPTILCPYLILVVYKCFVHLLQVSFLELSYYGIVWQDSKEAHLGPPCIPRPMLGASRAHCASPAPHFALGELG